MDIILVGIFLTDNKKAQQFKKISNWATVCVFAILVVVFCVRNIMYEPIIDFRAWKIGNKMAPTQSEQAPAITFATYKNNKTGEEKEFSMEDLMKANDQDANFQSNWTFISSRYTNPNEIKADGFSLLAFEFNEDESLELLSDTTSSLFILAVVDMNKANDKGMRKASDFLKKKFDEGQRVIVITASQSEIWFAFQEKYKLMDYVIYSCDDKAIEAMVRNNPAIVEIKDTKVANKWSWRDL